MKSIKTIRLYAYLIKTLLVLLIFALPVFSNTMHAQNNDFIDNGEIQLVAYPEDTDNPAWDAVKDFTVTSALEGRFIDFTVRGADGGEFYNSSNTSDQQNGGEGLTITMRVAIGSGPNEIPVGSTIRMILGEGDVSWAGGGGTGLAFRRPYEVPGESRWVILAVSGGGGGAASGTDGRPGRANTSGYWGRGTGTNENNGFVGEDGYSNDDYYAKGGRGYLSSLSDTHEIGEPVGSFGLDGENEGTFGFGGGGGMVSSFWTGESAGGGGGYSGGGGGSITGYGFYGGGGGGSWINADYAITSTMTENGTTDDPMNGYVEYLLVCPLAVTAEAEITDIVTLFDNGCDATFDSVWLNFITDPQALENSCSTNLTYAIYNHDTNNWLYNDYANGNIEKGVKNTIFVTYNDVSLSQKTFVFPEFEWRDEADISLTTNSTITVDAQDLVNLTGTSTPLIQNFNFQFLNADGSIVEGEQKTFAAGSYTQKIGLISFAGTIICQYEMTINIKAPEIEVNHCTSGNTELIENINPIWYRFNGHHTQWQSFSPEGSGLMESLYFELVPDSFDGFEIPQNATLNIHRGEGTTGELIYTKDLAGTLGTFNTVTIDETLYLQEDEVYTFAITDPTTTNWGLPFYITDFYLRGRHFIWNDRDVAFRVNLTEVCDADTGMVSSYMENTEVGTTNSKTLTISNIGTDVLTISSITSSSGLFTIGTHSSSIPEGDSTTFELNFTPTSEGEYQTTITITSNDLNVPNYSFDITGVGIVPLQLSCKDDLVFTLDENDSLELGFDAIVDTIEGPYTSSSINASNSLEFNGCNAIGDYPITLEISTSGGTSMTCNTTVRVNPRVTYPDIEDVTLYFNRGGALPTYDYDVSAFDADCPAFSEAAQIEGLPSGSQFPQGTTTNTFEISTNDLSISYSFDVTVIENPVETLINLEEGELAISDWNTITDDDQITLSTSSDGTMLYISDLNGSVQLLGSALSYEGDTGRVVAVPMSAITNGIKFNGRQGDNAITIAEDIALVGTENGMTINDISNYTQLGVLDIEGDFSITGDADIVITDSTFDGTVSLQGNTIDIRAVNEGLTLGAITATGTATTDMNYIYSDDDVWLSSPVQTAGDSNLTIRGNIVQQASSGVVTTNELVLEGNSFGTSGFILDVADNNINKLSSNTTDHLTSGILFKDLDVLELGAVDTGAIYFTADTFTFTESTNLTFSFDSLLAGGINQTATNSSSPARINHNGGKLRMYGATPYTFTGAFQYTAVAGTTTQITSTAVLIDTPNHEQTFGKLDMYFESFTVAAGSIVNMLNKGEFQSNGTSLEGSGTVNGNIDIVSQAILDPGTDAVASSLTVNGDLKLYTTSINSNNFPIFKPLIESDINYDVLNLTGSLELDNVKFEPTGDFTITDGTQEIVLIQNDGTDPIIGTFHGLPEGASFDFGGFSGVISYMGGDGNDFVLTTAILVSPKVYLQGASINPISGEESLMRDDLRVNGLFPLSSPYGDGLTIDASILTTSGSDAIVDWVWVELRDQTDSSIIIDSQSALLQRDGDVVSLDGISPLAFVQSEDRYYIVIKHRNHVGIMTTASQLLSASTNLVDFTADPSMVEGGANSVLGLSNGYYGMYTGDFDGNAQIQNTDANAVIQLIGGAGYEYADMDVNTQIQNTDVNVLINPNIGRGEQFSRPGIATEFLTTDVTLAFANAQITNDGVDDYYEADIMISGTTDFYIGSGQVYLEYNTAAFGENVATNNTIAYSQPDGTILGYSFGAFSPAYRDFVQNDNTTSRVSLSFQQNVGLAGLETAPELEITTTPKVLFHIKIRYVDSSADANICFYTDGVFQDQFFTACGGTATADCTNTLGVQITNDSYDCSEAGVDTLGVTSIEIEQILLYPNPTSSNFRIKGLKTTSQIRIYDVNGRLILEEQRSDDREIDMSRYDNGVYLVEISTDRGMQINRLIKK